MCTSTSTCTQSLAVRFLPVLALSSDGLTRFAWGGTAVQVIPLQ
jgi:hypothetical protein